MRGQVDGTRCVAEASGVLKGMQIVQVNGIPVYDKKGMLAAISRGEAHETHFEFQRVGYGSNASLSTGLRDTTRQFDEESVGGNALCGLTFISRLSLSRCKQMVRRVAASDGRQQRHILPTREAFEEEHWKLLGEAMDTFRTGRGVSVHRSVPTDSR